MEWLRGLTRHGVTPYGERMETNAGPGTLFVRGALIAFLSTLAAWVAAYPFEVTGPLLTIVLVALGIAWAVGTVMVILSIGDYMNERAKT